MDIHQAAEKYRKKQESREFQIVQKDKAEAQKCINQWRHDYDVEIISVQGFQNSDIVIISLWRTKK